MSVTRILRRVGMAAATCVAMSAASTAFATNTLVTQGWANGFENFTVSNHSGAVSAGGFYGTFNTTPIDFWCIDLFHTFSLGGTYTDYTAVPYSNTRLSELFQADLGSALNPINVNVGSAAFQLAIWNIIYDSDNTVDAGTWFVSAGDTAARNLANSWLASLPSSSSVSLVALVSSEGHQEFVTPGGPLQQVPEPSSIPLLGAGLVAMLFAIRNRKSFGRKA